jgi:hypothetical protein
MYQQTYRPPDLASPLARGVIGFLGKILIWIFSDDRPAASTHNTFAEKPLRLLTQAGQEIESIRHDLDVHSLCSVKRSAINEGRRRNHG